MHSLKLKVPLASACLPTREDTEHVGWVPPSPLPRLWHVDTHAYVYAVIWSQCFYKNGFLWNRLLCEVLFFPPVNISWKQFYVSVPIKCWHSIKIYYYWAKGVVDIVENCNAHRQHGALPRVSIEPSVYFAELLLARQCVVLVAGVLQWSWFGRVLWKITLTLSDKNLSLIPLKWVWMKHLRILWSYRETQVRTGGFNPKSSQCCGRF